MYCKYTVLIHFYCCNENLCATMLTIINISFQNKLTAFPDADFKRGFSYEHNSFGETNAMFLVDTNNQLTVGFVRVDQNVTALSYDIQLLGVNVDVAAGGNVHIIKNYNL